MVVAWLLPRETAAASAQVLCRKPYNHTPFYSGTSVKTSIDRGCVCLGVTCHLHFWQNDQDLLRVTAVTWGGTDTEISRSQHRKLRRKFSRVSSKDSNPGPFDLKSGALTTELPPLPVPWCENVGRVFLVLASPYSLTSVLTQGEQPMKVK